MESNNAKRRISLRMTVVSRLLRSLFDRKAIERHNITRSQWAMISVVATNPGATQRTIAESLEMSEASAGRLIDRLCTDGLLERRERDDDRRAHAVYLTDATIPLMEGLSDVAAWLEQMAFEGFTEDELQLLEKFVNRLHDNVSGS